MIKELEGRESKDEASDRLEVLKEDIVFVVDNVLKENGFLYSNDIRTDKETFFY